MTLAFNSKHPYVYPDNCWIASLSDGTTVFEDITPRSTTAWVRLKKYVNDNNLHVTQLRLQYAGNNATCLPYRDENGDPQLLGYWQARKMGKLVIGGAVIERNARGVGYVSGSQICIAWITDSGEILTEMRDYDPTKEGVILND